VVISIKKILVILIALVIALTVYVRKQDDRFVCIDVRYTEIDAGHMKDMMRAFKELN